MTRVYDSKGRWTAAMPAAISNCWLNTQLGLQPHRHRKSMAIATGQLLITARDTTESLTWTNVVGVSASGNSLTKTAAEAWGNAGAASTQALASGDGYVEFTTTETNTNRMCGLSNGDSNQNYPDIDFAFYPANGALNIYEGGVHRGAFGTYAAGDGLRVAVEGGVVKYRKNGALIYTSTVTPSYPLLIDTALYSSGATVTDVVLGTAGGTSINWLVTDHLGTPRMIFDQTGSLANVKRHDYLPFGEELIATQGVRTTALGYTADTLRQKFTSHERDNESGLDYMQARYYSAVQGRFLSPDSFGGFAHNPQTLNRYAYVQNDPMNFSDPSGHMAMRPDDFTSPYRQLFGFGSGQLMAQGPSGQGEPPRLSQGEIEKQRQEWEANGGAVETVSVTGGKQQSVSDSSGPAWYERATMRSIGNGLTGFANDFTFGLPDRIDRWMGREPTHDNSAAYQRGAWIGFGAGLLLPGPSKLKLAVNVTSKARMVERALSLGERFVGRGYHEIAPGIFRSANGLRQFRMTTRDLIPTHGKLGSHVHFEIFNRAGDKLRNFHVPLIDP